jgi:hypothetical protein
VSFSPDGNSIAVGFGDSAKADVVSGQDLAYLYSTAAPDKAKDETTCAAWSLDGVLYTGGGYRDSQGKVALRKWEDGGKGKATDIAVGNGSIQHLMPLQNGGMVVATSDPLFVAFNGYDNGKIFGKESFVPDYRGNPAGLLVSEDGITVQFWYEAGGKTPARFSMTDRVLTVPARPGNSLLKPLTKAEGIKVTGWQDGVEVSLNDITLELDEYEVGRCFAITRNKTEVLLGTDKFLYLVDTDGYVIWCTSLPGTAWSVNISGQDKMAVAALSDGTIRWYRMEDGEELLAFLPHSDQKKWVAWLPSGYYDAAVGTKMMGWVKNNGTDAAADLFGISKVYHRPDVVAAVFEQLDAAGALATANQKSGRQAGVPVRKTLAPVVKILSPTDGTSIDSQQITIEYTVASPAGEAIKKIQAKVDGRPVEMKPVDEPVAQKAKGKESGSAANVQRCSIQLPGGNCSLSLIAETQYTVSEPAMVNLRWLGKVDDIKPKLYLLAVGVSKYKIAQLTLGFPAKDAKDMAEMFLKQKDLLYRDVEARLFTNEEATSQAVISGLEWIRRETTNRDVAIVFFSGHGVNDPNGFYYFLPHNTDLKSLMSTAVPFNQIRETVASLPGKTIFFVDSCHSGNVIGKRKAAVDVSNVVNELASAENGAVVFASSTGNQYSLEKEEWGNGAFTKAVLKGLNGKASYKNQPKISINMLDLYISERVKELTEGQQTPTTAKPSTVPDFPIAIVK